MDTMPTYGRPSRRSSTGTGPGVGVRGAGRRALARLHAGSSIAEANPRVRAIAARLRLAYPKDNANEEYGIVTLRQARLGGVRRAMVLVLCGSAPVLLL